MENNDYQFVVRVYNNKEKKIENHKHATKAGAESFKRSCNPAEYTKPVVYPRALYASLFGALL